MPMNSGTSRETKYPKLHPFHIPYSYSSYHLFGGKVKLQNTGILHNTSKELNIPLKQTLIWYYSFLSLMAVKWSKLDLQKLLYSVHWGDRLVPLNLSQPSDSWKPRALSMTTSQRGHVEPADLSAGVDNTLTLWLRRTVFSGECDGAEFESLVQSIQCKANVTIGPTSSCWKRKEQN